MRTAFARRGLALVGAALGLFAYLTVFSQFFDENAPSHYGIFSVPQFAYRTQRLAAITNLIEFEMASRPFDGACRKLELGLPPQARIYMNQMLGPTNLDRAPHYNYLTYYVFPRDVAVSLDQPAKITRDGFVGRDASSFKEMAAAGFDVEVASSLNTINGRPLRENLELRPLTNPEWFRSRTDALIAFLLPLLTALSGLLLLGFLFPMLETHLSLLERLACGLGLGMMAAAAVSLGIKLCGVSGRGLLLVGTATGAAFAVRKIGRELPSAASVWVRELVRSPAALPAILFLVLVFQAAGILGLVETDAVGAWMLKAKIMFLYSGQDLVHWFSEPRLAHAHLDYPTLVPSLHAVTFDSIGAVNEYVTKYWPAWMLLLLIGALASVSARRETRAYGPSFLLLALMLLPSMRLYVESEGGTMPMIFFTTLGIVQCALGLLEGDHARVALGLTLLFGAAMSKLEGVILVLLAGFWLWLVPGLRPALKPSHRLWIILGFWLLVALPFLALRAQIPALHYESGWLRLALAHPGLTLSSIPPVLLMVIARWFVNPELATWTADGDRLQWQGHWAGFSSLYNHSTLGLAWLALLLTGIFWFIRPKWRRIMLWLLAVIASMLLVLSGVFASFVGTISLARALDYYTQEIASGRYLFPLLVAWPSLLVVLLYRDDARLPNFNMPSADPELSR